MSLWNADQFRQGGGGEAQESPARPATKEWLDRHTYIPIVFLFLLPFLVEIPLLVFGLSTNPIWLYSGVTSGTHIGFLPGLPYVDANVGLTTQALGRLSAEDWIHAVIPWWNPYSGIGLPLAGEMQPNAFFLPFVFFLLLHNGVLWLKIAMQIMAGLATFALLRELKLGRLAALSGGALYALNGTFAWMPGETICNTIPFLPLLLYGIERARKEDGSQAILWIGLAIGGSLLAGFPEAAYINGLMALVWVLYRFFEERRRWRFFSRTFFGVIEGILIAAPLLISFFDYLTVSDTIQSHVLGFAHEPLSLIPQIIFPYIYGPPFYINKIGALAVSNWGMVGGYIGFIAIFFIFLGIFNGNHERGLRWLMASWLSFSLLSSFGFSPAVFIKNSIPLLVDANYFRYSPPSWEMASIIIIAFAIDDLRTRIHTIWPTITIFIILSISVYIGFEANTKLRAMLLLVSIIPAVICFIIIVFSMNLHRKWRRKIIVTILIINAVVLFSVPELSGVHPGEIDDTAIRYIENNLGFSRFYSFGPLTPNYASFFGVNSVNYNSIPVAKNWADYVQNKLVYPKNVFNGKYANTVFMVTDGAWITGGFHYLLNMFKNNESNYENIGVKYIIAYTNMSAPIKKSLRGVRMVYSDPLISIWETPHHSHYYSIIRGQCNIIKKSYETVEARCYTPAILLRRELFMPGWAATVNDSSVAVSADDGIFQTIPLAAGKNMVRFQFAPPNVDYAWIAFFLGIIGLLWQSCLALFQSNIRAIKQEDRSNK